MGFRPDLHHRRSIRLADFDFLTAGAYFVTVCTYQRPCLYDDPKLKEIAEEVWRTVAGMASGLIDDFVIMPNHAYGIVWIAEPDVVGARQPHRPYAERHSMARLVPKTGLPVASPLRPVAGPPSGSLGAIVGGFKSATAKRINNLLGTPGAPVWQRNYYEHVIRSEADLTRVRQYIRYNPLRWDDDPENPANIRYGRATR